MKQKLACILLIDNDEPTNFLNKLLIQEADCTEMILVEQSASDALEYLVNSGKKPSEPRPELIFLDINMPAMDGWEFLEKYASLSQKEGIVLVMLTTSSNPEDMARARKLGYIADFRNKPLNESMLSEILRTYFSDRF